MASLAHSIKFTHPHRLSLGWCTSTQSTDVRMQITYLNSVVMPDDPSSESDAGTDGDD